MDAGVGDVVLRQNRQKFRIHAVIGKADSNVCLTAAERRFQHRGLEKTLMSRRFQAEHDLAKC